MKKVWDFLRHEAVLCVALLLAVVSSFFVTPDREYIDYIDFRTLAILFCLMCVMAGLQELGVFKKIAGEMLKTVKDERGIAMTLVLMCFFSSMLITNDVALITFVPFTFTALSMVSDETYRKLSGPVLVLETIAANLGSMLTPVGNPQNLYLYGISNMGIGSFIRLMLPYSGLSLVMIVACVFLFTKKEKASKDENADADRAGANRLTLTEMFAKSQTKYHSLLIMYILLFAVAIFVVIRVLPWQIMLAITLILVLLSDRKTILKVDYTLLITFFGFFVFIGNMGRIPSFANLLSNLVKGRETVVAILSSQIISNVPAALLLSGFTEDFTSLIIGTNLGGLGTLIASMASLISFKQVAHRDEVPTAKYFKTFTLLNIAFLAVLFAFYEIIK